jgi:hypothetical protein
MRVIRSAAARLVIELPRDPAVSTDHQRPYFEHRVDGSSEAIGADAGPASAKLNPTLAESSLPSSAMVAGGNRSGQRSSLFGAATPHDDGQRGSALRMTGVRG